MSYLFTAVSAEQQEMVVGGSFPRKRNSNGSKIVVAPVTVVQIAGNFTGYRGGGNTINQTVSDNEFQY